MAEPAGSPQAGLADLRTVLRLFPGVEVDDQGGAANEDGWWHLTVQIDRDVPGAWHSIAVLAKIFNTDAHDGGSVVFKPIARLDLGGSGDDLIMWSLGHLYGTFTAAEAAQAILQHLEDRRTAEKAED